MCRKAWGFESPLPHIGGLVIGKFEIASRGIRFTRAGFLFVFLAIAAIFFLVVGAGFWLSSKTYVEEEEWKVLK